MLIPKGFNMTLEQIGTGKLALVFVYDPNLSVSNSQTEQMNEAREQIGDQVFFLVANIGTPEGDQFVSKHHSTAAELLLFDPEGNLAKRAFALKNSNELIEWFELR